MIVQALRKGNYEHRVRTMSFERVMQRLELDYPGEGRKQLRIRLKNTARDFAAAFLAGAKKDFTDQQLKATREALNQFEMTHQAKAADPDFMASLARETCAENRFMQFLDDINSHITEHFVCRDPVCAHFMPSDCWATTGSQYRCPFCWQLYQPWKEKKGIHHVDWIPAQKTMAIRKADKGSVPGSGSAARGGGPCNASVNITNDSTALEVMDGA